jgi:endonuclease VIII
MAEGDTIHRTARRLESVLAGQRILDAAVPNPASPLRRQTARLAELRGRRLQRAEAKGKHLLLHFEAGLALHCHLGLRGSWLIRESGSRWRRPRGAAWVVLSTAVAEAAQFGGTRLALRTEGELRSDPRIASIGPDLLAPDFEPAVAVAALRAVAQNRTVGEAMLDQRVVAGVGNVYKSEGCFAASLDPWAALSDVTDADLARLFRELRALMAAGLERGRQPRRVYRRSGQPCPRCGVRIRSRGQGDANRTTYWCRSCQAPGQSNVSPASGAG